MLTDEELRSYCARLLLSQSAINLLEVIRASPPTRRVQARISVTTRYPSVKMGMIIQAESHRVELPAILLHEYDPEVLEFYDQPPKIQLSYTSERGRPVAPLTTPDFLVIRKDCLVWEEWKPEKKLEDLCVTMPHRYTKDEQGRWRCPPGEKYAEQFGFTYKVRSSAEINWTYTSNIEFLKDYWLSSCPSVPKDIKESVYRTVLDNQGIFLVDLLRTRKDVGPDRIYKLIADQDICVDLGSQRLAEPERTNVYTDLVTARANKAILESVQAHFGQMSAKAVDLKNGATVLWDDKPLAIINIGGSEVTLRRDNGNTPLGDTANTLVHLTPKEFEALVNSGRIAGIAISSDLSEKQQEALRVFNAAGPEERKRAQKRLDAVLAILTGEKLFSEIGVPERTLRDWIRKYREAEQLYGSGYIGLLDGNAQKGNREPRYTEEEEEFAIEVIKEKYEDTTQRRFENVYGSYKTRCEQKGILQVGKDKFHEFIKQRSGPRQDRDRYGKRVANQNAPWYWYLSRTTPPHGERPFHIVHIDHTQLDILLVHSKTGRPLGRPWLTLVTDAYTRRILVVYISYSAPSDATIMMAIRLLIKRYNRFPDYLVVDGGKDFSSIYTESLLAFFGCAKKQRQSGQPRDGNVIERLFGSANTEFVHNLLGNTQVLKLVRQVTKKMLPENTAVWDIHSLYLFLQTWAYYVYDQEPHPALGYLSPHQAFEQGILMSGERQHRLIRYDEEFIQATMPPTKHPTRKVSRKDGIKVDNIWYWSDEMRDPALWDKDVNVRYDPFDIGQVFFHHNGQWLRCISQHYAELQGHTAEERQLISKEIRAQLTVKGLQPGVNASKLVQFMYAVEQYEALLGQRTLDDEMHPIIHAINSLTNLGISLVIPDILASHPVLAPIQPEASNTDMESQTVEEPEDLSDVHILKVYSKHNEDTHG